MASRTHQDHGIVERKFAEIVEALSQHPNASVGDRKGFGSGALKVNGKIFAMMSSRKEFVVKLSKDRVDELVSSHIGKRFKPRPGRPMKEWLVAESKTIDWMKLAKEAREFVAAATNVP